MNKWLQKRYTGDVERKTSGLLSNSDTLNITSQSATKHWQPVLEATVTADQWGLLLPASAITTVPNTVPAGIWLAGGDDVSADRPPQLATVGEITATSDGLWLIVNASFPGQKSLPQQWCWAGDEDIHAALLEKTHTPLQLTTSNQDVLLGDGHVWANPATTQPLVIDGNAQGHQSVILQGLLANLPNNSLVVDTTGRYTGDFQEVCHLTAGQLPLKRFPLTQLLGAIMADWPLAWQHRLLDGVTQAKGALTTLGSLCQYLTDVDPALSQSLAPYFPTKSSEKSILDAPLNDTLTPVLQLGELPEGLKPVVAQQLLAKIAQLPSDVAVVWAYPNDAQWQTLCRMSQTQRRPVAAIGPAYQPALAAVNRITANYLWPLGQVATEDVLTASNEQPAPPHDVEITVSGPMAHHLPITLNLPGDASQYALAPLPTNVSLPPAVEPKQAARVAPPVEVPASLPELGDVSEAIETQPPSQVDIEADLDQLLAQANELVANVADNVDLAALTEEVTAESLSQHTLPEPPSPATEVDELTFELPGGHAVEEPEAAASVVSAAAPVPQSPYAVGTQVSHPRYGNGVVEGVTPTGKRTTLRIRFETVGKRLLDAEQSNLSVV